MTLEIIVPLVGKVTDVLAVAAMVCVNAPVCDKLPAMVIVFDPLLTPVPPYVPDNVDTVANNPDALLVTTPAVPNDVLVIDDPLKVVNAPVLAVVAPTVPLILIDAVPLKLVTVPLIGVPNAPPLTTNAPAVPTLTAKAVATLVPNPDTPVDIGNPVTLVIMPDAGVPRAGVVNVGLVNVTPANVVTVAPSATLVEPIVTVELVNDVLAIFDNVFVDPLIDLLVNVSVVALPTNVSVAAGNVTVFVPATAGGTKLITPDVEPVNAKASPFCNSSIIVPFNTNGILAVIFYFLRQLPH